MKKGFSLLELLLAVAIISVITLAFFHSTTSGMLVLTKSSDITQGYATAQQKTETTEAEFRALKKTKGSSEGIAIGTLAGYLKGGVISGEHKKYEYAIEKIKDGGVDFDTTLFKRKVEGFVKSENIELKKSGNQMETIGSLPLFLSYASIPEFPFPALKGEPEIEIRVIADDGSTKKLANTSEIWKIKPDGTITVDEDKFKKLTEEYTKSDQINLYYVGIGAEGEPEDKANGRAKTVLSIYRWYTGEVMEDGTISNKRLIKIYNKADPSNAPFKLGNIQKSFVGSTKVPSFTVYPASNLDPKKNLTLLKYGDGSKEGDDFLRPSDFNGSKVKLTESEVKGGDYFDFSKKALEDAESSGDLFSMKVGDSFKFEKGKDDPRFYYDYFALTVPDSLKDNIKNKAIGLSQTPVSKYGTIGAEKIKWIYLGKNTVEQVKKTVGYFGIRDGRTTVGEGKRDIIAEDFKPLTPGINHFYNSGDLGMNARKPIRFGKHTGFQPDKTGLKGMPVFLLTKLYYKGMLIPTKTYNETEKKICNSFKGKTLYKFIGSRWHKGDPEGNGEDYWDSSKIDSNVDNFIHTGKFKYNYTYYYYKEDDPSNIEVVYNSDLPLEYENDGTHNSSLGEGSDNIFAMLFDGSAEGNFPNPMPMENSDGLPLRKIQLKIFYADKGVEGVIYDKEVWVERPPEWSATFGNILFDEHGNLTNPETINEIYGYLKVYNNGNEVSPSSVSDLSLTFECYKGNSKKGEVGGVLIDLVPGDVKYNDTYQVFKPLENPFKKFGSVDRVVGIVRIKGKKVGNHKFE